MNKVLIIGIGGAGCAIASEIMQKTGYSATLFYCAVCRGMRVQFEPENASGDCARAVAVLRNEYSLSLRQIIHALSKINRCLE